MYTNKRNVIYTCTRIIIHNIIHITHIVFKKLYSNMIYVRFRDQPLFSEDTMKLK